MPILTPHTDQSSLGPLVWRGAPGRAELVVKCNDSDGNPFYGVQVTYAVTNQLRHAVLSSAAETTFDIIPRAGEYVKPLFYGTLTFDYLGKRLLEVDLNDVHRTQTLVQETPDRYVLTADLPARARGSDAAAAPQLPTGLAAIPTDTQVILEWDPAGTDSSTYQLRLAEREEDLPRVRPHHVYESRVLLEGLDPDKTYYAEVLEIAADGVLGSAASTSFQASAASEVMGFLKKPFRGVELVTGTLQHVDLANYIHLAGTSGSTQAERWGEVTIDVETYGDTDVAEINLSGTDLAVGRLPSDTPDPMVAVVRLRRSGYRPLVVAFPIWQGAATQLHEACVNLTDRRSFLRTSTGTVITHVADPRRYVQLSARVDASTLRVRTGSPDGRPQLALFHEDDAYVSVLMSGDVSPATLQMPILPAGTVTSAETPAGWEDVAYDDLLDLPDTASGARPERWSRVVTDADKLYDVSLFKEAEELRFTAPRYYGTYWYDAAEYPPDARLLTGRVVYRNGLESPVTSPEPPRIVDLVGSAVGTSLELSWRTLHPDNDVPVDIPVYVSVKLDGAGQPKELHAYNRAVVRGLLPARDYLVDVLGTSTTLTTEAIAPTLTVEGYPSGLDSYRYHYRVTASGMSSWTDPSGNSIAQDEVTITTSEAIERHVITVTYSDSSTRTAEAWTQWILPATTASFDDGIYVGHRLPADAVAAPTFFRSARRGSRSATLPYNSYAAGTWRIVVEGALPPGLSGELEDYVDATFVAADGRELGGAVALTKPQTLAIRLTVHASSGLSPVVDGARPVSQTLT